MGRTRWSPRLAPVGWAPPTTESMTQHGVKGWWAVPTLRRTNLFHRSCPMSQDGKLFLSFLATDHRPLTTPLRPTVRLSPWRQNAYDNPHRGGPITDATELSPAMQIIL